MVNTNGVAVQLKTIRHSPYEGNISCRRGNHGGPSPGGIVYSAMVIVFGKDAIVVATDAVLGADSPLNGTDHGAIPEFLGGDDGLKGGHPVKLMLGTQVTATRR